MTTGHDIQVMETQEQDNIAGLNLTARQLVYSDISRATQLASDALALARSRNDALGISESLSTLAICADMASDFDRAMELLREAGAVIADMGYESQLALISHITGLVEGHRKNYAVALEHLFRALAIRRRLDDKRGAAGTLNIIGICYREMQDYTTALHYYLESLDIFEQVGDLQGTADEMNNIGSIHLRLEDFERAFEWYGRSLERYIRSDSVFGQATIKRNLGLIHRHYFRDLDLARACYEDAAEKYRSLGMSSGELKALVDLGEVLVRKELYDEALAPLGRAEKIALEIRDQKYLCTCLILMADALSALRKLRKAQAVLSDALKIAEENTFSSDLRDIHEKFSMLYDSLRRPKMAFEHYRQFVALKDELKEKKKHQALVEQHLRHEIRKAEEEKERYRLRSIELQDALRTVETLNEKLQQLGRERNQLVSIVVHDLKNPLSSIRLLARLIRKAVTENVTGDIIENARDIEQSADRMFELIHNFLSLSAIESGKLQLSKGQCDLAEILSALVYEYGRRAKLKDISLHFHTEKNSLFVQADSRAVVQIFENLISNAVKYSPLGKDIWIVLGERDAIAWCTVQDEGPGLSEDDKKKVFNTFERLSAVPTGGESSTGLGLAIVKRLVDEVEGRVWCESEAGQGAKFFVELPKAETEGTGLNE